MADYLSQFTGSEIDSRLAKVPQLETGKQDKLVSGTNIKTINGASILGNGDMTIQTGDPNAVKYVAQTLTEEQKAQARANIDAASLADINNMDFVTAATLPTASASTMGHIYLIGPDENDNYDRYFTQEDGSSYSWVSLGSTQIDLSTYATQSEVDQLEHEVHNLSGKYYGIFSAPGELPEADTPGYAFVGATEPLTLFNYNGEEWLNTDIQIAGIIGPEGKQGLQGIQGIQGPAGITSAVASADNQTGIPYVEVSVENGVASFIFHNIKGEQGNSGYSGAAGELEVVNNTTQGGSTSALSAEMGKELQGQIDGFTGDAEADLDIVDDNGSVLARFENGDFRVKNFNSALAPQQGENNITPDFAIADENGNAIAIFRDGHIQTKNFDSNEATRTPWYGKKVSIIGDSISTAIDHNAVEFTVLASDISAGRTLQGYPTYYDIGTKIGTKTVTSAMVGVLTSFTPASGDAGKTIGKAENYNTSGTSGVASYTDTWWHKLTTALGMQVLQNVSWSGASICSHEGDADAYKTSYAWHPAQINKLATRNASGVTIAPDVVIIYRGTNDMTHTPYASLTDFGADATSIPDTDFANSSYDFKAAYCLTVKKIREAYPQAKIVLCTLNVFKRINYSQFPTNNGINTLPEYNNAIREVADMMGCGLIEFDKDGITFENCYPTYISDSSTESTHPNPTGHTAMAEKAIIDIKKY